MAGNQLKFLSTILRDFLDPLQEHLADPGSLEYLFSRYGWNISLDDILFNTIKERSNIVSPLSNFLQTAGTIDETLGSGGGGAPSEEQLAELLRSAQAVLRAAADFKISSFSGLPEPLNQEAFWKDVSSHILDDLLEEYLRVHYAKGYLVFHLFGVIRYDFIDLGDAHRLPYVRTSLDWGQALDVIKNPLQALKRTFRWDDPERPFENQRLFETLRNILRAVGISANLVSSDGKTLASIPTDAPYTVNQDEDGLWTEVLYDLAIADPAIIEIAVELLPAVKGTQTHTSGIFIRPIVRGASGTALKLSPSLKLVASIAGDAGEVLTAVIFPDRTEWASGQPQAEASIELVDESDSPRFLLGDAETTRVEITGGSVGLSMRGTAADPEILLYAKAGRGDKNEGCKVVVPLDESDAFVKESVKQDAMEFAFPAEIAWSNKNGLQFNRGSVLDVTVPFRIQMGGFTLQDAHIAFAEKETQFENSAIEIRVGAGIKGSLGPIDFALLGIGFTCTFTTYSNDELRALPPEKEPLFGNVDVGLRFAHPTGVGLSIDGGGFKGGGFLDFEPEKHRYVGMLELEFQEQIALKAIGLLTTRLPSGEDQFSLLISITSEFTPIQLGYGFTLNGVGGLIGLNRTMMVDRLRTGIRDKTFDSILFPDDLVANAERIISDLRKVFPPRADRIVFGPMGKIGWGSPTLITLDAGLAIEIPEPITLALLGVLKAELPDEKKKLLQLRVNFLGVVDLEKEQLSFDAAIYDSNLLKFPLSGDMALRLNWGNRPNFLLTVGGFHPNYDPPPMALPPLRRMTVQLLDGRNPRIRLESYFAVTSNTVQFGAKVELYAASGPFNVYGMLAFDALFRFSPFYFIADVRAMLALRRKSKSIASIKLELTLEGVTPWKAKGTATLKICWFLKVKIRFDKTFGRFEDTRLDDLSVLPMLEAALRTPGNWEAALPNRVHMLVSVKEIDASGERIIAHPFGVLTVSQKIVPLNVRIDKVGRQRPRDGNEFRVTSASVGSRLQTTRSAKEFFAPAQFFEMNDEEKLTSRSFEEYDSGVRLSETEQMESDHIVRRNVEYKLSYIDSQRKILKRPLPIAPNALAFNAWTEGGAISKSALSKRREGASALAPAAVQVTEEEYLVVKVSDMTPAEGGHVQGGEGAAIAYMNELIAKNPSLRGRLQAAPAYEIN